MTRLADALERANSRAGGPAPARPAGPAAHAPLAPASAAAPALALVNATPENDPRLTEGPSLLALPRRPNGPAGWRTDPELIGKLVGTDDFSSGAREQYRKLAALLHHGQVERGLKVVMTSSALPGEGKSLTAVNLALTLAESYQRRVLLIDADLRRPTVQRIFAIPPITGLNDGLKASEDRPMAITAVCERLFVLPAGRPEADPMSGLTSDRMRRLIAQAASSFEWVIVDSPPVGLLPDASLLSAIVDGVLLVVRAGKAPFSLVKRTVDSISHDRILGVVMNAIDIAHDRNAGGYYEYYGGGYYGAPNTK